MKLNDLLNGEFTSWEDIFIEHKGEDEIIESMTNYIDLDSYDDSLYILIEKYTTFSLKSIPLLVFNELLIKTTSNAKTYDKNGYEARNLEKVLSRM